MTRLSHDDTLKHGAFLSSPEPHVLMITNHGVHEWQVIPGLPDTGGQNVFVNQFTDSLINFGYKVTIVNRGGYPHPNTGKIQAGMHYKNENQRILYLEDGKNEFVRKEDMHEQIPALVESLKKHLHDEDSVIDLIISHYWDAAQIGFLYNNMLEMRVKHIWVPHSLGELKKSNVNPDRWMELRIDERIQVETALIDALDGVVSTSSTVKQTLLDDYGYSGPDLFLPPCVNTGRFHPRQVPQDHEIWQFLSAHSGLRPQEIRKCKIISEISRTDTTKRKDVLIKAFARAQKEHPDSLLVVSIDAAYQSLAQALTDLINYLGIRAHTAVVGSIWDILPALYAVTDIYCTPSIMEGFGMSAQEAAATGVPVVSSNLVPFVSEYLLGSEINNYSSGNTQVLVGEGAIVAEADDIEGFSFALNILLSDGNLREMLGRNALKITVPYFTWDNMVKILLERIAAD